MKKLAIGIAIAVMVLSIGAMSVLAASEAPGYVDADGDGICDYAVSCGMRCGNGDGAGFADEDGDGICDRRASCGMRRGNGRRANFVDADGDGACDNAGAGCRRNG